MKKKVLIFIDRDGTIVYDKKYHLGHQKDWKKKIKIMPQAIGAIKKLNQIPNSSIYMISNQPGIAVKNFKLLTKERANQVCSKVIRILNRKGARIQGFFVCGHASLSYVRKHPEWKFDMKMVHAKCKCRKPAIGMIKEALLKEELRMKDVKIYVMGDRSSDVRAGINARGIGILVPFVNRPDEPTVARKIKSKRKYIAKDFLDAVRFIKKNENPRRKKKRS